jgi:glutamyl-Q tRNA(Asp) synthetase
MTFTEKNTGLYSKGNLDYIGRFAPSPTGPLHFGSLVAAVASYLDAKTNNGKWLVRVEDLDPPREPPGAADLILSQLKALGLDWDGEVLYQSSRLAAYEETLATLTGQGLCFACDCTRPRIQAIGSIYDGHCRNQPAELADGNNKRYAIRLKTSPTLIEFEDLIQGDIQQNIQRDCGDFVIKRKDKLFAYQLAVVVDDAYQQVTHVVRGYDLLDSTPRQNYLQQKLNLPQPTYAHFPVAANGEGEKLSKQHFAASIDTSSATEYLLLAMKFLGLDTSTAPASIEPASLLTWAVQTWDIQRVPKLATINGSWSV